MHFNMCWVCVVVAKCSIVNDHGKDPIVTLQQLKMIEEFIHFLWLMEKVIAITECV